MPKLTKSVVEAGAVRAVPYYLWCSDLPGFGVRIFPSGRRVYYADYTPPIGGRRRMSLGLHGKLTTEEARKLAIRTLGDVLKGVNPADERAARRKAETVKELVAAYFKATDRKVILGKRGMPKKASTLASDRGRAERHILPLLGSKRVADLTSADLNRFMRDVTAGRTAGTRKTEKLRGKSIVKGGAGVAKRTLALLGGILTFAVSEGIITAKPAGAVKRQADQRRTARLTADTYAALGSVLTAWERDMRNDKAAAILRLLALTGCRKGEIERLRWVEVDAEGQALRLLDSKEGASTRPIGAAALAVLARLDRVDGCQWVFAGRSAGTSYGGLRRAWRVVADEATLPPEVTLHTLRHSFASVAGDLGYSEPTIAALLGHAAGTVTSRYVHHLDAVLVAAADKVAAAVAGFMEAEPMA